MMDSYMASLESYLYNDEKKILVEEKNICGRLFGNVLAFVINFGILAAIFYFYITEDYYLKESNYVWIVVFFIS